MHTEIKVPVRNSLSGDNKIKTNGCVIVDFTWALKDVVQSCSFEQGGIQLDEIKFGIFAYADLLLLMENKEVLIERTQGLIKEAK